MVSLQYYLSEEEDLERTKRLTGLSEDEIESVVGKFSLASHRCGKFRGKVEEMLDGTIVIRHHFNRKVLWKRR